MAEIHGVCDKRFEAVRAALAESLDGEDVGACAAVYLNGEPVVDIWGGYADAARTIGWRRDTITNVWSTTKTMAALCALILADRGDLDLSAPVARYWPEFAAAGKEGVLVRHVLSHTSGLPEFDGSATAEDQYHGFDQILGTSIRYGMGCGLLDGRCFWGGWGDRWSWPTWTTA